MKPKRIYLDQNKWIELARLYYDKEKDSQLKNILNKIIEVSESGQAIFPISFVNLGETWNKIDDSKRSQLADLIIKISKGYSIAPYSKDFRLDELEQAIAKRHGLPIKNLSEDIIKQSMGNIFGSKGATIKGNIPELTKQTLIRLAESPAMILWSLKNINSKDFKSEDKKISTQEFETARKESNKIENIQDRLYNKAWKLLCSISLEAMLISSKLGVKLNFNNNREEVIKFIQDMPATYVSLMLSFKRNLETQRKIHPHDLNDIYSFAMAIPYCDVVVGEKYFINLAQQAGLDKKYNTILLHSLKDLDKHL